MKIGFHVSSETPITDAPLRAHKAGCEIFQMFTRSPRGGGTPQALNEKQRAQFAQNMKKGKQARLYVHTPYFINLASANNRIRYGSISAIRDDLERGSLLGATAVMTHLGSANDTMLPAAIEMTAEGIEKILDGYTGQAQFLMEMAAGAGKIIGSTFDQLKDILKKLPKDVRAKVGICFDTCHAYASGYDLRTKTSVNRVLQEYDKKIGFEKLALIHANDSKYGLGEHKDRHEHIGYGEIGLKGFHAIVHHPKLANIDMILETPADGKRANDLKTLKSLRSKKTV